MADHDWSDLPDHRTVETFDAGEGPDVVHHPDGSLSVIYGTVPDDAEEDEG